MKIELKSVPVLELTEGYQDKSHLEQGIVGYSGNLDIRPAYQREFVYNDEQRAKVIDSIINRLPLNVMYWVKRQDDTYEVLDGQQRSISICQFVAGEFSILDASGNPKYFSNLSEELKEEILGYELMVYFCEGTNQEKLDWFKTINIAGERLTNQELRNAVYTGAWLAHAKKYFSKTGCPAYNFASNYVKGVPIKQDYLELVLSWIADANDTDIESYMSEHQEDLIPEDTSKFKFELWDYFQEVIFWVRKLFPNYRRDMKGLPWGLLYNQYKSKEYDPVDLEIRYRSLLNDDEVQVRSTKGIYFYLITDDKKYLNLRAFDQKQKQSAFDSQQGLCNACEHVFTFDQMEADHIIPWSQGGKTVQSNCQMLCKTCNRSKSNN